MTSTAYFERLYAESDDPWKLASRAYEQRKYDVTLAALPRRRYRHAFEPACSIGVLTSRLAQRCDQLLAMDGAARAVDQVRTRVGHENVRVELGWVPADWPTGMFDLVVLSELMYYLSAADRHQVIELATASLADEGHLLTVNWRHPFPEAAVHGDAVKAELRTHLDLQLLVDHTENDFTLQVFGHG